MPGCREQQRYPCATYNGNAMIGCDDLWIAPTILKQRVTHGHDHSRDNKLYRELQRCVNDGPAGDR